MVQSGMVKHPSFLAERMDSKLLVSLNQFLLPGNRSSGKRVVADFPLGWSEVELGAVQGPAKADHSSGVGGHSSEDCGEGRLGNALSGI